MKGIKVVMLLLVAVIAANSNAAVVNHWALDETSLAGGPVWTTVVDSVGTVDGAFWSVSAPTIGVAGPVAGDLAYDFGTDGADAWPAGVVTGKTVLSATGNFTVEMSINPSTADQAGQHHLFSNNNGQVGRAALMLIDGDLMWWVDGGSALYAGATNLWDGNWHDVAISRSGDKFALALDGFVMNSIDMAAVSISQDKEWMIGRARSSSFGYEGLVSDVKVYDNAVYVPEPATMILFGLGGMLLRKRR